MSKLLVVCYEYPPLGGGGAKVVQGLCEELVRGQYEIDLVTMGFQDLPRLEEVGGVQIHRIPSVRSHISICHFWEMIPYILLAIPYTIKLVKRGNHRINHTHFIFPDGLISSMVARATGLPFIISAHGSDVPGYNPDRFKKLHRLLMPIWRRIINAAQGISCPSASLQSLILRHKPDATTWVIPNGIDVQKFEVQDERKKSLLVVTRMFERKGVQYLLEAMDVLDPEWEIEIMGDGPYLEALKKINERLGGRAHFHGHVDNKSAEFKERFETAGIFVFTSEAENFPIVLLEAMTAGLPIITTHGTGCAEVVGDAALLVEPKDIDGLRTALLQLTGDSDLRDRLGAAARARVEDLFTWRAVAKRTAAVLEEYSLPGPDHD